MAFENAFNVHNSKGGAQPSLRRVHVFLVYACKKLIAAVCCRCFATPSAHHGTARVAPSLTLQQRRQQPQQQQQQQHNTGSHRCRVCAHTSPTQTNTMRNLNLSRIARASEGSFFKTQQATQAEALRRKLSPSELTTLRSRPTASPSVDTLPEISAHSAYRRLDVIPTINTPAKPPTRVPTPPRLPVHTPPQGRHGYDPTFLRALGPGRLSFARAARAQSVPTVPLPGSARHADGAVLGLASFSVATSIVAAVGLAGGLVVYFNPAVVDAARLRTRRFAQFVDRSVGERMRSSVDRVKRRGPLVDPRRRERLRLFLNGALGRPQASTAKGAAVVVDPSSDGDDAD